VPGPDSDGEVEGGDDADRAERMPLFHHAVGGAFGGDGEAVELAGESDGKVADVDHFLDFAERLLGDLADFEGDEIGEIGFAFAEFLAEATDELAALGGGDETPLEESFVSCGGSAIDIGGGGGVDGGEG